MTEIVVIAALADNGIIGKNNQIPWHISEDLRRFKRLTTGYPVVMGRKTWESMNCKPLPGRRNIVLTHQRAYTTHGCEIFHSLKKALKSCGDSEKVFIIGGTAIYSSGLEVADTLELTRVHKHVEGDTFFPEIDFSKWRKIKEEKRKGFSFLTYKRKINSYNSTG